MICGLFWYQTGKTACHILTDYIVAVSSPACGSKLSRAKDNAAIVELATRLADEDCFVRTRAVVALGKLGVKGDVETSLGCAFPVMRRISAALLDKLWFASKDVETRLPATPVLFGGWGEASLQGQSSQPEGHFISPVRARTMLFC